jgi:DNA-binding GntR family transcriptional regulator
MKNLASNWIQAYPIQMEQPKSDQNSGQDIYTQIIHDIRLGNLLPGDRLTETDLAERFKISRTPVREAIRRLEAHGLVVHIPRLGATIRTLDRSEVSELYEMRAVLESTAARLAARAASPPELAEIIALQNDMLDTSDTDTLYHLNQLFHAAILDAARNRFLVNAVQSVQKTLLILGRSTMEQLNRVETALDEHQVIIDAMVARDEEAAENAMRGHIQAAHAARLAQKRFDRSDDRGPHDF